jgi:hypothetical protein
VAGPKVPRLVAQRPCWASPLQEEDGTHAPHP